MHVNDYKAALLEQRKWAENRLMELATTSQSSSDNYQEVFNYWREINAEMHWANHQLALGNHQLEI